MFLRGWIIHSAWELLLNCTGCTVEEAACLGFGLCHVSLVSPGADLWHSGRTASIRSSSSFHTKALSLNPSAVAPKKNKKTSQLINTTTTIVRQLFEERSLLFLISSCTWGTLAISVKSRGWGAITCLDASGRPGTHQLPYGCIWVRKPCQHVQLKGLVLRSRGRQSREVEDDRGKKEAGNGRQEAGEVRVIVGSDSGGQCQASFRIHSLRSSCYIFYWRNKGMACYFHTRAIFLREASRGI